MNSPEFSSDLNRLFTAARLAPDDRETAAPYGSSTRVAALAVGPGRRRVSLFDFFALRALGVAALLTLVSVAANYSALQNLLGPEAPRSAINTVMSDDPVGELVDAAS